MSAGLRGRLAGGERLVGTWMKTPSPIVAEVLGQTDLDLVVLDAEHAPFGRTDLDSCVFALRASGMASLVRVPTSEPHHILQALDYGATGVLVPHVRTATEAEGVALAARFGPGGRGYAGSTRAAGYGTKPMAQHKVDSAADTVVVAQIEDAEAIEHVTAIATTDGLDALFIGTVDLSVSMGADGPGAPEVIEAVKRIVGQARGAGCPVGIFANTADQVAAFSDVGVTLFLMQSDHTFLRAGAAAIAALK